MPENETKKLNPQIVDVEIGIREMRNLRIYPLSMKDQLDLTDLILNGFKGQLPDGKVMELGLEFLLDFIQENVGKILSMATDEDESIINEISNMQAVDIAYVLVEVNYGAVSKNFKSLFENVMHLFPSEGPLPQSVNDTDTDSKTSTESPTEKEA